MEGIECQPWQEQEFKNYLMTELLPIAGQDYRETDAASEIAIARARACAGVYRIFLSPLCETGYVMRDERSNFVITSYVIPPETGIQASQIEVSLDNVERLLNVAGEFFDLYPPANPNVLFAPRSDLFLPTTEYFENYKRRSPDNIGIETINHNLDLYENNFGADRIRTQQVISRYGLTSYINGLQRQEPLVTCPRVSVKICPSDLLRDSIHVNDRSQYTDKPLSEMLKLTLKALREMSEKMLANSDPEWFHVICSTLIRPQTPTLLPLPQRIES